MIPAIRQLYNSSFTQNKYESLVSWIEEQYPATLDFRIAETPLFISKQFTTEMTETCRYILSTIQETSFTALTEKAIPDQFRIEGPEEKPLFMAFDFGICKNESGDVPTKYARAFAASAHRPPTPPRSLRPSAPRP